MNVTEEVWKEKLHNLHTRPKGISSEHQIDYKKLLKKVFIGQRILDVGCGTMWLYDMLLSNFNNYNGKWTYTGLDIQSKVKDDYALVKGEIENIDGLDWDAMFETLFVFAALDGMRDLDKAFENMKRIASKNIVILTGINILPDQYHTHLITKQYIAEQMGDWKMTYFETVLTVDGVDKIVFIEFTKP